MIIDILVKYWGVILLYTLILIACYFLGKKLEKDSKDSKDSKDGYSKPMTKQREAL